MKSPAARFLNRVATFLKRIPSYLPEYDDVLYFTGLGLVGVGVYRRYDAPLALMVGGGILLLTVRPVLRWIK